MNLKESKWQEYKTQFKGISQEFEEFKQSMNNKLDKINSQLLEEAQLLMVDLETYQIKDRVYNERDSGVIYTYQCKVPNTKEDLERVDDVIFKLDEFLGQGSYVLHWSYYIGEVFSSPYITKDSLLRELPFDPEIFALEFYFNKISH